MKTIQCHECSTAFVQPRADACFCSTSCRKTFNNRRAVRGAEVYDLFRALRRERPLAKELNIWTQMCRLELRWQEEDTKRGKGRAYRAPRKHLQELIDTGRLMMGDALMQGKRD